MDVDLSTLRYADDTIIFIEHNLEQAMNMKLLLYVFEQLSNLKINFYKSELFSYGEANECANQYTQLFGCKIDNYPFRYLGIPIHHRKLQNIDRNRVKEQFEKKLSSWKEKLMFAWAD